MSTSTLLQSLFKYKAWANNDLFATLEGLDAVEHAAAREDAIKLLDHVYVADRIFAAHLARLDHNYSGTTSPETPEFRDLRTKVASSDAWYVDYVANLSPDLLSEKISFKFTDGQNGCMSREEMLAHVLTHGNYHRGAVGRIMDQASTPPPRDIYTVYLHRSEPARRQGI